MMPPCRFSWGRPHPAKARWRLKRPGNSTAKSSPSTPCSSTGGWKSGTAQPTAAEQAEIPHHLVGCFDFHHKIDVFQFRKLADRAIAEIRARGRRPILAGGTGMYLRALLYGIDDLPPIPNCANGWTPNSTTTRGNRRCLKRWRSSIRRRSTAGTPAAAG